MGVVIEICVKHLGGSEMDLDLGHWCMYVCVLVIPRRCRPAGVVAL
jgi:hypothetical protein